MGGKLLLEQSLKQQIMKACSLKKTIMSCFSCYMEDDMHKAADSGPFMTNTAGNNGGYHAAEAASKDTKTVDVQPSAIPSIPVDELKEITDNFGTKALIGEGSYGRVYYGLLTSGQAAAIKKLLQ